MCCAAAVLPPATDGLSITHELSYIEGDGEEAQIRALTASLAAMRENQEQLRTKLVAGQAFTDVAKKLVADLEGQLMVLSMQNEQLRKALSGLQQHVAIIEWR